MPNAQNITELPKKPLLTKKNAQRVALVALVATAATVVVIKVRKSAAAAEVVAEATA